MSSSPYPDGWNEQPRQFWPRLMTELPTGANGTGLVGLLELGDYSTNSVALSAAGAFVVDWGDGTTENFSGWAIASHTYATTGRVIVRVYPQSGQQLTALNLQQRPAGFAGVPVAPWLALEIASPDLTSLTVGGKNVLLARLEGLRVEQWGGIGNLNNLLRRCHRLKALALPDAQSVTQAWDFAREASGLEYLPP